MLNTEVWKPTNYSDFINNIAFTTYKGIYRYDKTRMYPYIYQFEKYSNIDGTSKGKITRSIQPKDEASDGYYSGETYTRQKADAYIETTQTYWASAQSNTNYTDSKYYELIFSGKPNLNNDLSYYLASRYVRTATSREANFGIQEIENSNITGLDLFYSSGTGGVIARPMRPMVEIDLTKVKLDTVAGNGSSASNAYVLSIKR